MAKINSCVGKRLAQPADDCAAVRTPVPQLCTEGVYFLMHHATCLPFDDMQLPIVEDVSLLHQPNDDWNPRKAVQVKFSQLLPERGVMCSLRRPGLSGLRLYQRGCSCTDSLRVRNWLSDAPAGWLIARPHHLLKLPKRPACAVGAAEPPEDSWRLQSQDSQCIIACCGPALPGCGVHGDARSCWLSQSCLSAEGRKTEEGMAI